MNLASLPRGRFLLGGLCSVVAALAAGIAPQTITFPTVAEKTYGDPAVTLTATASSGLPVSFALVSGNGTVAGSTLTLTGGGSIVIEASQAGNDTYAAASPVRQTITVKPQTVTISVPSPTVVFTGFSQSVDSQITSNPSLALNGNIDRLVVSYNGVAVNPPNSPPPTNTAAIYLHPRSAGVYAIRVDAFSQLQRYTGSATGTLTITRMPVTVTLGNLTQAYDGAAKTVSVTTNPAEVYYPTGAVPMTTYLKVTYNGASAAPTDAGTYDVVATVDGADVTGSARGTLTITKSGQAQTITFPAITGTHRVGETFQLTATASSGLPVTFQTSNTNLATITGNDLTIKGVGAINVRATQPGNSTFLAATAVEQTFTAEQGIMKFSFSGLEQTYDGQPKYVTVTTDPPLAVFTGNPGPRPDLIFYDGASTGPINAGSYTVLAKSPPGMDYGGSATATMIIRPAPATVSLANLAQTVDGAPKTVSVTTQPAGLAATVTYNGSTTAPSAAGNYAVVATITDRNHTGSATGTLVLASASSPPPGNSTPAPPPVVTTPPPSNDPARAAQTIEFVAPVSAPIMGQPYRLSATSSAGLPITFSVVSGNATIRDNALTIAGPGDVVVRATQAGTDTIAPASAEIKISGALRAAQTLTFTPPTSKLTGDAPFTLSATSSTGLPVTFALVSGPAKLEGNVVTLTGVAGTVVIRASQAGNETTEPIEVTRSIAVDKAPSSRLANVSSRLQVSDGDAARTFITGFVIAGATPQRVLIRAAGPALAAFGVQSPLPNPRLRLFDATGVVLEENDDWSGADVSATARQVGAFALSDGSRDAAIVRTLAPGPYTVHVLASGGTGIALAEIFDASDPTGATRPPLANLSTRGFVGADEAQLGAGCVISGTVSKRVLIRGVGAALAGFGVAGALTDPVLTVYRESVVLATNDDWQTPVPLAGMSAPATAAEISAAATASGAFPLASGSKDAAVVLTLAPGAYTAFVSGANRMTGVALIEIYEVP